MGKFEMWQQNPGAVPNHEVFGSLYCSNWACWMSACQGQSAIAGGVLLGPDVVHSDDTLCSSHTCTPSVPAQVIPYKARAGVKLEEYR